MIARLFLFALLLSPGLHAASQLVEGWHHRVFGVYPVEKIKEDEELPKGPLSEALSISAARGESEIFVIALRSDVPLREIEVKPSDLKSASGGVIPATAFRAMVVGYIHVDEPSGTRMKLAMPFPVGTGPYPDPLLPGKAEARPGRNVQFLLKLQVPREAAPGAYEGTLKVIYRRESWMPAQVASEDVIKLALKVHSFALPERSSLLNTSYANLRVLPEPQRTPAAVEAFQQNFIEHHQTPEPLLPSPRLQLDPQGHLTVDSSAWEAAVAKSFARGGSHAFVPVWGFSPEPVFAQGIYFLYHYPAVTNQRWLGAKICQPDKQLTPEFKALFGDYLRHMHAVLQRNGWLDRTFIATMDEPYTYHLGDRENDTPANNYKVIRNYVAFVREVAPGLRTFCTADPVEGLNGFIDHWCLRNLSHAAEARERAEKHGEVFTFCDNYRTFVDYPAASARSLGWLAWKIGASGWLTYETLGNYERSWHAPTVYPQFSGGTVWGLGHMFYPDPFTAAPLPSLRWELMSEGCDDYEYLRLLAAAVKQHPNADAEKFLAEIARGVVKLGGDGETAATIETDRETTAAELHQRRERIAKWIDKLSAP